MTREEKTLLNDLLIKFFEESAFGAPNFLTRDSTAALLKKHLGDQGYWRNKARNKRPKLSDQMYVKRFLEQHKDDVRKDCPF